MDEFENVLCFCPGSRLSLASLVLSTWTQVKRWVVSEEPDHDLEGFSAVVVMDRFVTRDFVARLAAQCTVIVLAWNGKFEIDRYRNELGSLDVIYMGTDEALTETASMRYLPMINSDAPFRHWHDLYRHKRQWHASGSVRYRMRWLRARALPSRALNLVISSATVARQPHALHKTLASGIVHDKLVWAGNCLLDFKLIGLAELDQSELEQRITTIRSLPTADARLRASMTLIAEWRSHATGTLRADRLHHVFYVTNTLLRWAVLAFLLDTAKPATWFFGNDNLGLGLDVELYVHNLVPARRVAFLEFGGKTSETALYPRALHLLAREYYVIAVPPPDDPDAVLATAEQLRYQLTDQTSRWFGILEQRRRALYAELPKQCPLHEVHARVWGDFVRSSAS